MSTILFSITLSVTTFVNTPVFKTIIMMFIKSALTVFCVTAMTAAQSVVTETETATSTQSVAQTMETADPGSASLIDFGLTPSQVRLLFPTSFYLVHS